MQTPQTAPPAPPAPPAVIEQPTTITSVPGGVTTVTVGTQAVPSLAYLRARGSELSRQLRSATDRRGELARSLRRASDEAKPGLQTRITVLDERLVQLEKDIAENGRQLAVAGGLEASTEVATTSAGFGGGLPPSNVTAISVVFTIFVLCPIAISMARLLWRRGSRIGTTPPRNPESDLRLQRVEQGVDAIALEVERISEGQRFVTQLLAQNEKLSALGTGQPVAEPLHVQLNDTVMAGMRRDSRG